ncbi:hypothetical protein FJZ39_03330 [Candidatus Saccharibacteria bacterium]|nr:hypothetical protein [Candidatus Saccharibacteria bacterium]
MKTVEIEKLLDKIHDWIKSVDQKVSIALALEVGVLALIAVPTTKLIQHSFFDLNWSQIGLLVVSFVLFAYGMLKAVWALKPRLRLPKKMTSLLYFESISRMKYEDFRKKLNAQRTPAYKEELAAQVHTSSVIASKKHRALAESLILFVLAVTIWMAFTAWVGFAALS